MSQSTYEKLTDVAEAILLVLAAVAMFVVVSRPLAIAGSGPSGEYA